MQWNDLSADCVPWRRQWQRIVYCCIHGNSKIAIAIALVAVMLLGCSASPVPENTGELFQGISEVALRRYAASLSTDQLAGQMLMVGVEGSVDGRSVTSLDGELAEMLAQVQPGGVVLFASSFQTQTQLASLVSSVHGHLDVPALIATDHEGGLVARLTSENLNATDIPPAQQVGRAAAAIPHVARSLGEVIGAELRAAGISMNLAPVVDVNPPDGTGAIGRHGRTFSDEPERAGALAAEVVVGMQAEGVLATLKHFPGHGSVAEDSHYEAAEIKLSEDAWRARDLRAFSAAAAGGPAAMMTAHLILESVSDSSLPATINPVLVQEARQLLGEKGLLMTDAINMRAIRLVASEREIVRQAILAGHDIVLKPVDPSLAREVLSQMFDDGSLTRARAESSVLRILRAKLRLGLLGPSWELDEALVSPNPDRMQTVLGNHEHLAVVATLDVEVE